jgi:hypothetical protein
MQTNCKLVKLYRDHISGYAVIADGRFVFDPSYNSFAHGATESNHLARFIRHNFKSAPPGWIKQAAKKAFATARAFLRVLMSLVPQTVRSVVRRLLSAECWARLRNVLRSVLDSVLASARFAALRDAFSEVEFLRFFTRAKIQVYDLDCPLRFEWCGTDGNTMLPRPFCKTGYPA